MEELNKKENINSERIMEIREDMNVNNKSNKRKEISSCRNINKEQGHLDRSASEVRVKVSEGSFEILKDYEEIRTKEEKIRKAKRSINRREEDRGKSVEIMVYESIRESEGWFSRGIYPTYLSKHNKHPSYIHSLNSYKRQLLPQNKPLLRYINTKHQHYTTQSPQNTSLDLHKNTFKPTPWITTRNEGRTIQSEIMEYNRMNKLSSRPTTSRGRSSRSTYSFTNTNTNIDKKSYSTCYGSFQYRKPHKRQFTNAEIPNINIFTRVKKTKDKSHNLSIINNLSKSHWKNICGRVYDNSHVETEIEKITRIKEKGKIKRLKIQRLQGKHNLQYATNSLHSIKSTNLEKGQNNKRNSTKQKPKPRVLENNSFYI